MEELEQYLSGKMNDIERSRFEERLATDASLRAELLVREGLYQLRLQRKVEEVAVARKDWAGRRNRGRWLMGFAIAGLLGLALFIYVLSKQDMAKTPDVPPSETVPTKADESEMLPTWPAQDVETPAVQPEKEVRNDKPTPIADARDLALPTYPAPSVRGANNENKTFKALLDQLWYTEYPFKNKALNEPLTEAGKLLEARDFGRAYVLLQRLERKRMTSDTLRFLKGYCLMEMGEGAEAMTYFDGLEKKQPVWSEQLQWFRGLSLALAGDRKNALAAFKAMAARPKHAYRQQSAKAVGLME